MAKTEKGSDTGAGKSKQSVFIVKEEADLLQFLFAQMPDKSRKTVKALLGHQQVAVQNKIITQFNHPLKPGDEVVILWNKMESGHSFAGIKILYEDSDLIVIEKQAGLLSVSTDNEKERTAYRILNDYVKIKKPKDKVFVVHRLDRESSGVMMFAKSKQVQDALQDNWDKSVLERIYVVAVEGVVAQEQGTICSWLKENKAMVMYSSMIPDDGQKAVTHYKVIKKSDKYTLLEVKLETGRKNQIRVHMKDLGHPVVGDSKYGASGSPIKRLGLHARVLAFVHPKTGKPVRMETVIPQPFYYLF